MKFWLLFILGLLAIVAFKGYISRGVYQATASKIVQWCYTLFSISTFIIGVIILLSTFPNGIIGMTPLKNIAIALMVSVLICEFILSLYFIADDFILLFNWIWEHTGNSLKKNAL